jgi:hypothetical protein
VSPLLALGVSIRWARAGPVDITPLLAMAAAVFVARFVFGMRLGPITTVAAAAAGAAWAAAVPQFGLSVPTLVALVALTALRWVSRPAHPA